MEHLVLPRDPVLCDDKVPFVCREPIDSGPFLTFPRRSSPPQLHFLPGPSGPFDTENRSPMTTKNLEIFLQEWLFFGLLREIFQESFRVSNFIVSSGTGRFISTERLIPLLEQWRREMGILTIEENHVRHGHIVECISVAEAALKPVRLGKTHSSFDKRIRNSIVSTIELLEVINEKAMKQNPWKKGPSAWKLWYFDDDVLKVMVENGWCPNEAMRSYELSYNFSSIYFLSRLKKPKIQEDHTRCTKNICFGLTVDKKTYKVLHRTRGCDCSFAGIDMRKATKILREGSYPLINIRRKSNTLGRTINVEAASSGAPYVAISHVWAHGIGNPFANALPLCQLDYIQSLVTRLSMRFGYKCTEAVQKYRRGSSECFDRPNVGPLKRERRFSCSDTTTVKLDSQATKKILMNRLLDSDKNSSCIEPPDPSRPWRHFTEVVKPQVHEKSEGNFKSLFFWLDTLCCPVDDKEAKLLALGRMRQVYENAESVLVLDSTLLRYRSDELSRYDMYARIITSPWMGRLWTMQESYLTKSLWIQFDDWNMTWMSQLGMLQDDIEKNIKYRSLAQGVVSRRPINYTEKIVDLQHLSHISQYRSVSQLTDEPLCLATLLTKDVSKILYGERISRMERFWLYLSSSEPGIPKSIIFHPAARIKTTGFRWAPQSLLYSSEYSRDKVPSFRSEQNGFLRPNGLQVKFPALELKLRPRVAGLPPRYWNRNIFRFGLTIRVTSERYLFVLFGLSKDMSNRNQTPTEFLEQRLDNLILIYSEKEYMRSNTNGDYLTTGIIGTVDKTTRDVSIVESRFLVQFQRKSSTYSGQWEETYQASEKIRQEHVTLDLVTYFPKDGPIDEKGLEKALFRLTDRVCEISDTVVAQSTYCRILSIKSIQGGIANNLHGDTGIVTKLYNEDAEWIID